MEKPKTKRYRVRCIKESTNLGSSKGILNLRNITFKLGEVYDCKEYVRKISWGTIINISNESSYYIIEKETFDTHFQSIEEHREHILIKILE